MLSGREGGGHCSEVCSVSCLVVGGGLIGQASATALAEQGWQVTVVTRVPPPQELRSIDWRFGSICDPHIVSLLAGQRAVVYAAGSIFPATPVVSVAQAYQDHVFPVIALAERAAAEGVSCFVFLSSGGAVYGDTGFVPISEDAICRPISLYGTIKLCTEQALFEISRRTGMSVVVLRVSNPYGPGQQGSRRLGFIAAAVEAALKKVPVKIWGDGKNTRDFVHIEDVAKSVLLASSYSGGAQVLNIGSGKETSLLEICRLVTKICGVELTISLEPARLVDVRRNALEVGRAELVLGWVPEVELEDGIAALVSRRVGGAI